jgi:voltage-gated potassium channel
MGNTTFKSFIFGVFLLAIVIIVGTYTFSIVEGVSLFDSLYNVILIITTVESNVMTFYGKILVIALLAFGLGLVLYIAIFLASGLIEGQTRLLLSGIKGGLVRMRKEKNHIIVCGYGKLGKYVCEELKEKKQRYLIVDNDADKCAQLLSNKENVLQGDVLDPAVLKKASIAKAKGLIATLGEDSDNIYLVITAIELNSNLSLAAKATEERAVDRLHKVGAKIVVLPQVVGGRQLANAFLEMEKSEELETVSKSDDKKSTIK